MRKLVSQWLDQPSPALVTHKSCVLTKNEIPTPALLVDLDLLDKNIQRMAVHVKKTGKHLRPHAKAHKCSEIAKRQLAAGAIGVCVATVAEAEVMSSAGIGGLLLTSPQADPLKIARAIVTGAMAVVDHVKQVGCFEDAAAAAQRTVDVLVDLDVGDHRTGASSLEQAMEIARAVERAGHLRLRGLQGYFGRASHTEQAERKEVSESGFRIATAVRDAMRHEGLSTEILTGVSTGTWLIDSALPDVTELQAGSYALMDLDYRRVGLDFEHSLTVLSTVVSANHPSFVTIDAGLKALATDRGYGPEAVKFPGAAYRWGGDEFGYLEAPVQLGDKLELIPPHCDPTVNLYDRIYACRGDRVEAIWAVMDRL